MRQRFFFLMLCCLFFQAQSFAQQSKASKDAVLREEEISLSQNGATAIPANLSEARSESRTDSLWHLAMLRADSIREEISDNAAFSFLFQEALRSKANEDYALTVKLLQKCISLDSTQAAPYYELAPFLLADNKKRLATLSLEQAHKFDPDNSWFILQLAQLYQSNEDYSQAIELLEQLTEGKGDKSQVFFNLANLYLKTENYDAALNALTRLESNVGKQEEFSLAKARIYLAQNREKLAVKELQSLIDNQPDNPHYPVLLSDFYSTLEKYPKAYSILKKNLKDFPGDSETLISLAEYYHRNDDTLNVDNCFQQLLNNPEADVESKFAALQYYLERYSQQQPQMAALFDKVISMHPEEFSFRKLYLSWLLENGHKNQAKKELRSILDANPAQEQAWVEYLDLYGAENSIDTIASICDEALSYYPESAIFWYYKGQVLLIKEETDSAFNAMLMVPRYVVKGQELLASSACCNLADISHLRGETEQSYDYYKLALAFQPTNTYALNNFAYFLCIEGGDLDRAEQMSKLSIQIESHNSTFLDTYAWICYKKGNYPMAKIYIERAFIYLEEPNAEICEHYGDILWACDEKEAAHAEWMKAAALNPNPSEDLLYKAEHGEFPSTK